MRVGIDFYALGTTNNIKPDNFILNNRLPLVS